MIIIEGQIMMAKDTAEYLTVEEAAVRAHVSSITIRRAIRDGKLRYRAERGRTRLLAATDVDTWVRERTELRVIDGGE